MTLGTRDPVATIRLLTGDEQPVSVILLVGMLPKDDLYTLASDAGGVPGQSGEPINGTSAAQRKSRYM